MNEKKQKIHVLIGSNGGLTGVYLAKRYREKSNIKLFGFDANIASVGKFFVDKQFCKVPVQVFYSFLAQLSWVIWGL